MEEVQWLMEPMDMSVREPARTVAQVGWGGSRAASALANCGQDRTRPRDFLHMHHHSICNSGSIPAALSAWFWNDVGRCVRHVMVRVARDARLVAQSYSKTLNGPLECLSREWSRVARQLEDIGLAS
jgi:hypothetical protein